MKKYLFLCLTAGLLAGSAHAVTLAPGTMETRLAGQLDPTTADGTQVDLNFSWGYFFADNAQAGGRLSFLNSDHVTLAGAAAFAEYNFDLGGEDWLPFVEGSLGLMSGDLPTGDSDTAVVVELQAGLKFFLAPNVALSSAAVLDYATEDLYVDEEKAEDTDIRLQFAIRYYY